MPQTSIIEQRREQTFPVLSPSEVERLRGFGEVHHFRRGDLVVRGGNRIEGLMLVLSGICAWRESGTVAIHA